MNDYIDTYHSNKVAMFKKKSENKKILQKTSSPKLELKPSSPFSKKNQFQERKNEVIDELNRLPYKTNSRKQFTPLSTQNESQEKVHTEKSKYEHQNRPTEVKETISVL